MKHKYDIGDTVWMLDLSGAPCSFEVTCIELSAGSFYYKGGDIGYVKEDLLSADASDIPELEVPGALKRGDVFWFFDSETEQVVEQRVDRVAVWSPATPYYYAADIDIYLAESDIHRTREAAEEEMAAYCRTRIEEARQQCQEQVDKYNGLLKSIGKEAI